MDREAESTKGAGDAQEGQSLSDSAQSARAPGGRPGDRPNPGPDAESADGADARHDGGRAATGEPAAAETGDAVEGGGSDATGEAGRTADDEAVEDEAAEPVAADEEDVADEGVADEDAADRGAAESTAPVQDAAASPEATAAPSSQEQKSEPPSGSPPAASDSPTAASEAEASGNGTAGWASEVGEPAGDAHAAPDAAPRASTGGADDPIDTDPADAEEVSTGGSDVGELADTARTPPSAADGPAEPFAREGESSSEGEFAPGAEDAPSGADDRPDEPHRSAQAEPTDAGEPADASTPGADAAQKADAAQAAAGEDVGAAPAGQWDPGIDDEATSDVDVTATIPVVTGDIVEAGRAGRFDSGRADDHGVLEDSGGYGADDHGAPEDPGGYGLSDRSDRAAGAEELAARAEGAEGADEAADGAQALYDFSPETAPAPASAETAADAAEPSAPSVRTPASEEGEPGALTSLEGNDDHTALFDAVFSPAPTPSEEKPPAKAGEPSAEVEAKAVEAEAGPAAAAEELGELFDQEPQEHGVEEPQDRGREPQERRQETPAYGQPVEPAKSGRPGVQETEALSAAAAAPPVVVRPQSGQGPDAAVGAMPAQPAPSPQAALERDGVAGSAPRRPRRALWTTVAVFAFLLVGYVGACFFYSDRIPSGTQVSGVDVGGMSRADAEAKLTSRLGTRTSRPITVKVGSQSKTINPEEFDAGFNVKGTLNSLTGFSLNPARLWRSIAGGGDVAPKLDVDRSKLTTVLRIFANETDKPPINASLSFNGTTPVMSSSAKGQKIDMGKAVKTVERRLLSGKPIALPTVESDPDITDSEADQAYRNVAEPLVSGPLNVSLNSAKTTISPEQLAAAATFSPKNGKLALELDPKKLGDALRANARGILKPGKDARIEIVNHTTPTVVPSEDGVGVDDDKLASEAAKAITGNRSVVLTPKPVTPAITTEAAQKMGVKEVVAQIETPLTDDAVRTKNLQIGTAKVANTLVKPGDTFSLLKALGPIDEAHGFVSSGVVSNGFNSTALGGGLSQLSTNTYNLGFLAGYEDIQHKPHSKYFSRYPIGHEATLWEGKIDMIWKNTSKYGAVIDTWVADGKVYSRLWSTKYWDVEVKTSAPYNKTSPTTRRNPAADCQPSNASAPGFTVNIWRKISLNGTVHKEETTSWTYQPVDAVVCH